MELISQYLNQGLAYTIPMIILLGLLVFVHELGHFLAAKFFGVRVETFSLGFGPQILKYKKGFTTYCISAVPLGGYVKMFGDIYGGEINEEDKSASYMHKPVFQRIIVSFAGPLMNLLFAGVLFFNISFIGTHLPDNHVGYVFENSEAFQFGFRSYDKILTINGANINFWQDAQKIFNQNKDSQIAVEVLRNSKKIELSPNVVTKKNPNSLSGIENIGVILGLTNNRHYPYVGVQKSSQLSKIGLQSGDKITKIGNHSIKYFYEIEKFLEASQYPIEVEFERTSDFFGKKEDVKKESIIISSPLSKGNLGLFIPETLIVSVKDDSPAQRGGLLVGDRITTINQKTINGFDDIVSAISGFEKGDPPLTIGLERQDQALRLNMTPLATDLEDKFGVLESRPTIGIIPLVSKGPSLSLWKAQTIGESVSYALQKTKQWTGMIAMGLVHMFRGKVDTKNIGGIFSIGAAASYSWAQGMSDFLKMMAIISINLFILNLLPVPVLDGGHLLIFFLEALKGAPLSVKKVELANQVGFLLVLVLMAFALFNDFSRMFGSPS